MKFEDMYGRCAKFLKHHVLIQLPFSGCLWHLITPNKRAEAGANSLRIVKS
jgi:hypothetical protein